MSVTSRPSGVVIGSGYRLRRHDSSAPVLRGNDGGDVASSKATPQAPGKEAAVDAAHPCLIDLARYRFSLGWLASAVVHCILLTLLAVLTLDTGGSSPSLVISSGHSESPSPLALTAPIRMESAEVMPASSWRSESEPSAALPELGLIDPDMRDISPDDFSTAGIVGDPFGAAAAITGEGGRSREDGQSGAQFFGVQAGGDDFVFVVDSSFSMRPKFADALRELEYSLRDLTPSQRFYVIFFDHNAERMTLGTWNERRTRYAWKSRPEPDMVPATKENIDGCVRWMYGVELESWTNPHKAMAFALQQLRPDAIFLLSDGEFTDRGKTEEFLRDADSEVIIHCIGFYSRQGEVTLRRIAASHGGTYRFVEPPGVQGPPAPDPE